MTWLGQGGFLLESEGRRLVVDPYLSDALKARGLARLIPTPLSVEELRPEWVCFTHDHADHFDEQTVVSLAKRWPDCRYIGPGSVWRHYRGLHLRPEAFTVLNKGEEYRCEGLTIRAVPAWHTDPDAVGLVVHWGHRSIYLSGDTEWSEELTGAVQKAAGGKPDVVMICINGKWGNMTDIQAAQVVEQLSPRMVVPMHYGLFADNTIDPRPFALEMKRKRFRCVLMVPGEPIVF